MSSVATSFTVKTGRASSIWSIWLSAGARARIFAIRKAKLPNATCKHIRASLQIFAQDILSQIRSILTKKEHDYGYDRRDPNEHCDSP